MNLYLEREEEARQQAELAETRRQEEDRQQAELAEARRREKKPDNNWPKPEGGKKKPDNNWPKPEGGKKKPGDRLLLSNLTCKSFPLTNWPSSPGN